MSDFETSESVLFFKRCQKQICLFQTQIFQMVFHRLTQIKIIIPQIKIIIPQIHTFALEYKVATECP